MASALVALANLTLSTNTASVTFSGFNTSTYKDIIVIINGVPQSSGEYRWVVSVNNNASSQYTTLRMTGDGSSSSRNINLNDTSWSHNYNAVSYDWRYVGQFTFFNVGSTSEHKTMLVRDGSNYATLTTGKWNSTDAITEIKFALNNSQNWGTGTTFAAYGVIA